MNETAYRNHTIRTEVDVYTGYVTVTSFSDDFGGEESAVKKGAFRSQEIAVTNAKARIDEFWQDMEQLGHVCTR